MIHRETMTAQPTSDCCEVVKCVPERLEAEVSEIRRRVKDKDDCIKSYHHALSRLWEAVRIQTDQGVEENQLELSKQIEEVNFQRDNKKDAFDGVTDAFNKFKEKAQEEYNDMLLCPLLWAKRPPPDYCSTPLSFKDFMIKPIGGAKPVTFEKGSKSYLTSFFPEDTTYRVPFGKKNKEKQGGKRKKEKQDGKKKQEKQDVKNDPDNRQLCHIPDENLALDKQKYKAELSDRKGRKANEKVASCLEKWGLQNRKSMMILTDLKVPDQNLNCPKDIVSTNGDFDVLVLCKEFILLCQVKGVDQDSANGTKKNKLRESWEQSIRDIQRFGEITRDISFVSKVPIYTAIAVPNLSKSSLEELGVCRYHSQFTLTETEMASFCKFEVWMSQILSLPQNKRDVTASYSPEEYDAIRARFVGIMCKVRINSEQSIVCDTDRLINPVKYTRGQKLHLIMTPEQKDVVEDESRLKIIQGNFGTGKSLVLIAKVQKLQQNSEKLCCPLLISCADIGSDGNCYHRTKFQATKHLRYLTDMSEDKSDTRICSMSDLIKDYFVDQGGNLDNLGIRTEVTSEFFLKIIKWKREKISLENVKTSVVHFFLDEIPAYFFDKCEDALRQFPSEFPLSYLWIVVAVHSSKPTQKIHADYAISIENLCEEAGFTYVHLGTNMRLPENVFSLVEFIQNYEYDGVIENVPSFKSGHDILGPKPLFFEVPDCSCKWSKNGADAPLTCNCSERRLRCTLEQVMKKCHIGLDDKTDDKTNKTDDKTTPQKRSNFKILIGLLLGSSLTKTLCALLKKACATLGIKLNFNLVVTLDEISDDVTSDITDTSKKIEIDVLDQYTYVGCEDAVIIGLDPYGLLQCGKGNHWTHSLTLFTRTTALYIHVLWSPREAKSMWHGDLDSHDKLTRERMSLGHLTEELQIARFSFTGQGRKSTGDLLEKLLQTQCVIRIPVEKKEHQKVQESPVFTTENEQLTGKS